MRKIRCDKIETNSYVDGVGRRTVIFLQGCPIHCEGCQNKDLWGSDGGFSVDVASLAVETKAQDGYNGNVTISGGEPFAQKDSLLELIQDLKGIGVQHIIVYTGYSYEELIQDRTAYEIFKYIDILVDGKYIKELDDDMLVYRGSRNQRPINVKESTQDNIVLEDWDNPEIVITPDGNVIIPLGLATTFDEIGKFGVMRMCGQTKEV